jgi:hypothetical protein
MASDEASMPPPAVEVAERDDKAAHKEGTTKKRKPGFFVRIWRRIFGGMRSEDYEKRLQYLSKEEATVHARIKKRAQSSRRMARNLIAISILSEVRFFFTFNGFILFNFCSFLLSSLILKIDMVSAVLIKNCSLWE